MMWALNYAICMLISRPLKTVFWKRRVALKNWTSNEILILKSQENSIFQQFVWLLWRHHKSWHFNFTNFINLVCLFVLVEPANIEEFITIVSSLYEHFACAVIILLPVVVFAIIIYQRLDSSKKTHFDERYDIRSVVVHTERFWNETNLFRRNLVSTYECWFFDRNQTFSSRFLIISIWNNALNFF